MVAIESLQTRLAKDRAIKIVFPNFDPVKTEDWIGEIKVILREYEASKALEEEPADSEWTEAERAFHKLYGPTRSILPSTSPRRRTKQLKKLPKNTKTVPLN